MYYLILTILIIIGFFLSFYLYSLIRLMGNDTPKTNNIRRRNNANKEEYYDDEPDDDGINEDDYDGINEDDDDGINEDDDEMTEERMIAEDYYYYRDKE